MVHLAFAFNFNIQRTEIAVGDEDQIIDKGYQPLVDLLLKHGMKADFFISGYSTETLMEMKPKLLDTIKSEIGSAFELGTYTYTHPVPQLLTIREFEKQIEKGIELDKEVYGVNPEGFLPPEFAYSHDMSDVLVRNNIKWIIALAKHVLNADPSIPKQDLHKARFISNAGSDDFTVVPAIYELPGTPQRVFKKMMKGELDVDTVVEGVKEFSQTHEDSILLMKRDAETIFIDEFNSGFTQTRETFDKFLEGISKIDGVVPSTIGGYLTNNPPKGSVSLKEHLGNTKLETFTEGEAKPIWDLTLEVREKLFELEKSEPDSDRVKEAWNRLLLSHNSDGRIGYWYSEWNPGEHVVAPSRRQFIEDNLKAALKLIS